jgi:hypothetical protein
VGISTPYKGLHADSIFESLTCVCHRLFQRLMSPEGPNLRRYYLPGLEHLKLELSCFELLLSSHQPLLHQHLLDAGLPAVLYAAQWLMTTYACPFPIHVSCVPDI